MRRLKHPFFALVLSLLLVTGQQAALAHALTHTATADAAAATAAAATAVTVDLTQEDDADHGAALALSHHCTTCLAFAGIGAAAPVSIALLATAAGHGATPLVTLLPAPTLQCFAAFRSRAPPLL